MQLFYAPEFPKNDQLPTEEAKHCFRVLRKQEGDIITVIDGNGIFFKCEIIGNSDKNHHLKTIEQWNEKETNSNHLIHIAIAPTKNMDRIEWFVEKAIEIGIAEISFILCDHSERKVIKPDRILKKAASAVKQSIRARIPKINDLIEFKDLIKKLDPGTSFIAHLSDESINITELMELSLSQINDNNHQITILIGPEGDFSKNEIDLTKQIGIKAVKLGTSRLRTETAGIVACTLLNF